MLLELLQQNFERDIRLVYILVLGMRFLAPQFGRLLIHFGEQFLNLGDCLRVAHLFLLSECHWLWWLDRAEQASLLRGLRHHLRLGQQLLG